MPYGTPIWVDACSSILSDLILRKSTATRPEIDFHRLLTSAFTVDLVVPPGHILFNGVSRLIKIISAFDSKVTGCHLFGHTE